MSLSPVVPGESESIRLRPSNFPTAESCSKKTRAERRRKFFRVVAKHAFPRKTARELVTFTGKGERTIYDWLAGRTDAPGAVLLALLGVIAQREMAAD